ncbi:hypothetical protein ABU162_24455 [Paenibacillus thiaminolyticus]|uniref:AlkZ-related protein n=1 Tax=Paenibacillus thiaminolyticus TaxID=49283 RepID=UPI0035A5C843
MKQPMIYTYEEAIEVVRAYGILPLAPLFPDYPSLSGITLPDRWHSDTELDPWRWRVRFPGEGVAAYGKFVKKKAILVASDLIPSVKALLGSSRSIEERYGDGLLSKAAKEVYGRIEEEQGIETRALRAAAGMKAKESKKEFDQGLAELQSGLDIVISGVRAPLNEAGEEQHLLRDAGALDGGRRNSAGSDDRRRGDKPSTSAAAAEQQSAGDGSLREIIRL